MRYISPKLAGEFAARVYTVKTNFDLKAWLMGTPEFSNTGDLLSATTGSRLINTRDAFAVCARGGEQYKNDVFLIFRGTATKADMVTDARTGLSISTSGSLVQPYV